MSADDILQRLLLLLPLAHENRDGNGVAIDEVARELGIEPQRLLADIEELKSRSYYLPAGIGDQIQLRVTGDRLIVWTTGEYQRPIRLTPREAMAVDLGLRILANRGEEVDADALHERLVARVRACAADHVARGSAVTIADVPPDPIRDTVQSCCAEGRVLTMAYRALGRPVTERRVAPLMTARAEGHGYLVARDLSDDGLRAFRLDRILEAEDTGEGFDRLPIDAEAEDRFLGDGRVHDGSDATDAGPCAVVEYAPTIARWIRERGYVDVEERPDGGLRVRHRIHDPEWIVRHVLSYGADAWIVEPHALRARVADAMGALPTLGVTNAGGS